MYRVWTSEYIFINLKEKFVCHYPMFVLFYSFHLKEKCFAKIQIKVNPIIDNAIAHEINNTWRLKGWISMLDQCFWNRRIFVLFTFMNTNTFVIVLVSWNSKVILRKENTHNLLKYLILAKPLVQKLLIGSTNEISTLPTGLDIDNRIINLCLFA